MLSNFDIEDICLKMDLPLVGVLSKDKLPDKRYIGSYYINMENEDDGNGTHWVYVRITSDSKALYFDSYGFKSPKEVEEFLKPFKPYPTSNRQIQSIDSDKCGLYCIACDIFFTYHYDNNKDFDSNYNDFLNGWSIDLKKNDKILKQYLNKNM